MPNNSSILTWSIMLINKWLEDHHPCESYKSALLINALDTDIILISPVPVKDKVGNRQFGDMVIEIH